MTILLVYVDDIIVTGSDTTFLASLVQRLNTQFALKDLGSLSYFLGIQAQYTSSTLHLCQQKYITDLLASMFDCKHISTPMASSVSLSLYDGEQLPDPTAYQSIVGALQYCTITRPNISLAVNKVCQFLHSPTIVHWKAVKRILCYLKGTLTHGLSLQGSSSFHLTCYTDADWASCPDDRKNTSGHCCFFGSNLISWSSFK